jgi:electron transfer flavoprotein beta subunit
MPVISYVEELMDIDERRIRAKRNVGTGWEAVECRLPVLLTVMETANVPRPPAVRRVMKYKKARSALEVAREVDAAMAGASDADKAAEAKRRTDALAAGGLLIEQWTLDDIAADLAWCGRDGSPTKVHRIQSVVLAGGAYREFPPTAEGAAGLIGELIEDHTIG